jgi:hypothetical protein
MGNKYVARRGGGYFYLVNHFFTQNSSVHSVLQ